MKKLSIIITLLYTVSTLKAQNVPYEKLEKFSKEISKIQFDANGKTYNDVKTDYEISFPEENFRIFFNSQLATNVVYKKSNNKELMYLTENISLGRVVGFTSVIRDNNIIVWKIDFGKYLQQKFEMLKIDCFNAKIITPRNKEFGTTGIYIDSLKGGEQNSNKTKFCFYGENLKEKTEKEFIKALKSIKFKKYCH